MIDRLLIFLQAMETEIVPPEGHHHVLMASKYGSNENGWTPLLLLQVNDGKRFQQFFLDELSFSDPEGTARKIGNLCRLPLPGYAQLGESCGCPRPAKPNLFFFRPDSTGRTAQ